VKTAWDKVAGVYDWLAEIVADYPRAALGIMLALAVMAAL
jgi:hypothetical protein